MKYTYLKPIKRSKFRIALGKRYFILKRKVQWFKSRKYFPKLDVNVMLPYGIFKHKTPLYRGLKAVDSWMDDHKVVNISLAIKNLNGLVIHPGQVFSYWKLIGNPRKSKGYLMGMVLDHGKFKSGRGGGLCQLSNLIFWMTLHSPLEVIERHRHSYDVFPDVNRTQPFGSGATCVYNYRDLQIKNNTQESFQFKFEIKDKHLFGEILSSREKCFTYKIYESSHHITLEHWGGYLRHNAIYRKVFTEDDQEIDDAFICENHGIMMYAPLLEDAR